MTQRTTITLEDDSFSFLVQMAGKNRSAYINRLLKEEQRRLLAMEIEKANEEEAQDSWYQEELAAWDVTLDDGLGE